MFSSNDVMFSCPVEALSSILGKKWVPMIIWVLKDEKKRFGELQKLIEGCSKKMLNQQLDLLIRNGIVANDKSQSNNTVESFYYLTNKGVTLMPIIESMIIWGEKNLKC
ncbi:MAG: winged helix-turn-helix transcriptional regulator [Cellulosilyticaceae bacterium]